MDNIPKYIKNVLNIAYQQEIISTPQCIVIPQVMEDVNQYLFYLEESMLKSFERNKINVSDTTKYFIQTNISNKEANITFLKNSAWAGSYRTHTYIKGGELYDEITMDDIFKIKKLWHILDWQKYDDFFKHISELIFNELYKDNLSFCDKEEEETKIKTFNYTALILFYIGMILEIHYIGMKKKLFPYILKKIIEEEEGASLLEYMRKKENTCRRNEYILPW